MKKLNITKEQFNRSHYFKNKYGRLEYVSESGKVFKTSKGKILKFKESTDGGKARIERLCTNLEKQYDTFTYDEIERNIHCYYGGGDGVEFEEIYKIKDKYFSLIYSENDDDRDPWDFSIEEVVPKQVTKTIYVAKE